MNRRNRSVGQPDCVMSFSDRFPDVDVRAFVKYPGTVELAYFSIPEKKRGRGYGSKAYAEFEKSLPPSIQYIELFAADTGRGNTDKFWEAQGFDYKYQSDPDEGDLSYEAEHTMIKKRER